MCRVLAICVLFFVVSACTCAQNAPSSSTQISGSDEGTLACKNEKAVVTLLQTITPTHTLNVDIMNQLIERGDCLILPTGWVILEQDDPPLNRQADHASKWTIRTPHGIIHLWGLPMAGD